MVQFSFSLCTVISPICCAVGAPIRGARVSGAIANSIEYFFVLLAFLTIKCVVPKNLRPIHSTFLKFCRTVLCYFL